MAKPMNNSDSPFCEEPARRAFLRLLGSGAALAAAEALTGCGSGHNTTQPAQTTFTSTQRLAALSDVNRKFTSLQSADRQDALQQMAVFMQSHAAFTRAGLSLDGSAWGRFKDGTLHIVTNNLLISPEVKSVRRLPTRQTGDALPAADPTRGKATAYICDGLGSAFPHDYALSAQNTWLPGAGYATSALASTPETLKTLANAGFLLLSGHGGGGENPYEGDFAFWTGEKITDEANVQKYAAELAAGRVVSMSAGDSQAGDGSLVIAAHWGITPRFVRQYLSFTTNSLVLVFAGSGNSGASIDMRKAFFEKGCGVYVGYDNLLYSGYAQGAYKYLIPRLVQDPASTSTDASARAKDYVTIAGEMKQQGLDISQNAQHPERMLDFARLLFTPNDQGKAGDFGILSPSLANVMYDGAQIMLTGVFGATQGQILVTDSANGTETPVGAITQWTSRQIVCAVSPTFHYIKVRVDGRTSNTVFFTAVDRVEIALSAPTVLIGSTVQATAVARDKRNNPVPNTTFQYVSDNPSVATVDAHTGVVTGLGAGTANISAVDTTSGKAGPAVSLQVMSTLTGTWKGPVTGISPTVNPSGRTATLTLMESNGSITGMYLLTGPPQGFIAEGAVTGTRNGANITLAYLNRTFQGVQTGNKLIGDESIPQGADIDTPPPQYHLDLTRQS